MARRMVRQDLHTGDQKMSRISSFKIATGMLGIAALVKISVFAIALAMLGSPAQAGSFGQPCTTVPQSQWLSIEALQVKVEALGYKVQKAKLKNACGELYTLDKSGNRVELFVDPASGKIMGQL
jgi:hypothetical protein